MLRAPRWRRNMLLAALISGLFSLSFFIPLSIHRMQSRLLSLSQAFAATRDKITAIRAVDAPLSSIHWDRDFTANILVSVPRPGHTLPPPSDQQLSGSARARNQQQQTPSNQKKIQATEIALRGPPEARMWLDRMRKETMLQHPSDYSDDYFSATWRGAERWMTPRQVLPATVGGDGLARIIHALRWGRVVRAATPDSGGTQLKILLELEGGQEVLFKPKRTGIGFDKHNAEVAAFHLSRILDIRRAPVAVGRRLHVANEILPVASAEFRETFRDVYGRKNCFYGLCTMCRANLTVCPDDDGHVEGVMILMLPKHLRGGSNLTIAAMDSPFPFRVRTEEDRKIAGKIYSREYCDKFLKDEIPLQPRLLDIVETSIVDFLIHNIDRHQYEFIDNEDNGAILLLDQGKSFRWDFSEEDALRLLAPLTQCCVLRETTYQHLRWISRWDVTLSRALLRLSSGDIATPDEAEEGNNNVLLDKDLAALDRRMDIVQEAMSACLARHDAENVLMAS